MADFQVVTNQLLDTGVQNNVMYWQLPDNQAATIQGFADALRTSYVDNVEAVLSSSWTLESITVRQMDGGLPFSQEIAFTAGALAGDSNAAIIPAQCALLVSTSVLGGKPNRGRIYFSALTVSANTNNGRVLSTTGLLFEDLVEEWRDGLDTGAGNAFLRIARPNFSLNDWTLDNPVETVIHRSIWATQRRRRPGVGV